MSMLLRRLQPPNKLTRSVRVQIQETCVFSESEPKFVAYCEKGERNIKFTPKMTLQQIRQFMIKIEDRQPKESILLKFIDNNTQVMGDNEFLILMTKRRIDPIWNTILYIQTMITAKNFTLYHVDFNYEVESEKLQFFRAKTEILVLSGEISRAASDYVSIDSEEQYEDSLSVEDYCRYVTYKMVHYVDVFGGARINSAKFSFFGKLFVTVEKMDLVEITKKLMFDSENLLKKKKIENEDDQLYQRLLELNLTEEREHAIKVYSEILQMENKFIDSSHLMKNKLTVTGDIIAYADGNAIY